MAEHQKSFVHFLWGPQLHENSAAMGPLKKLPGESISANTTTTTTTKCDSQLLPEWVMFTIYQNVRISTKGVPYGSCFNRYHFNFLCFKLKKDHNPSGSIVRILPHNQPRRSAVLHPNNMYLKELFRQDHPKQPAPHLGHPDRIIRRLVAPCNGSMNDEAAVPAAAWFMVLGKC